MNNKLRYIQYARKSSEAKERQALSIQDQNSECNTCETRDNLNVAYKLEESHSAFKPHNRPEFDRMLNLIQSGQANAILTWKPDRLCRNPEEGGKILQMLQDGQIKEIRTATGDIYTQDSDHLVLQIHFGMANQYSRNLSQNVKRGLSHKCERGEYPRPACIGYECYGDRGRRNIRPHPVESVFVREAYEMMATGKYSLGQILLILTKKGLRTKKGKEVGKSHLYNILTVPTYYGYFYQSGVLYKGNYEPVITKRLYDNVQDVIHNRSRPKSKSHIFAFTGQMMCGNCGCAITATEKHKFYKRTDNYATYIYYHCTRRRGNCNEKPIELSELEKQFDENLKNITIDKEAWSLGIKLLRKKYEEEARTQGNIRKSYQADFNRIQSNLDKLLTLRMGEEVTPEEYAQKKKALLDEQARMESLINDNTGGSKTWLELAEDFFNTAYQAREMLNSDDLESKRKATEDVGWNLILKDGKVKFSFKQPFDILLQPDYRTNVLPD